MDSPLLILSTWLKGLFLVVFVSAIAAAFALSTLRTAPYSRRRLLRSVGSFLLTILIIGTPISVLLPTPRDDFGEIYGSGFRWGFLSFLPALLLLVADMIRIDRVHMQRGFSPIAVPKPVESLSPVPIAEPAQCDELQSLL